METEKVLEPLGEETIKVLKASLPENKIYEWLYRSRPTLDGRCPFDFLADPTPKKIEQVRKVIQCLAEMRRI